MGVTAQDGGWHSPVRDVRGAQQCGQVGDGAAQGTGLVTLRLTGEEVEGDEGSVGASQQGQAVRVQRLSVQRLLHCQLHPWGTHHWHPNISILPGASPQHPQPSTPHLGVCHILLTHMGKQGADAGLAEAQGATVVH